MNSNETVLIEEKEIIGSEEDKFRFKKFFRSLKEVKEIKKILIFRSTRIWAVKEILSLLIKKYPDSELSVLAQPSVRDNFQGKKNIIKFFWMKNPSKEFGIFNIGFSVLRSLRREKYDLVVVPLSGKRLSPRQLKYSQRNLHNIIMAIKPKNVIFVDNEGVNVLRSFNSRSYFLSYFFHTKIIFNTFINIFMFAFMLFTLLAIIVCDLWCILKNRLRTNFFGQANT